MRIRILMAALSLVMLTGCNAMEGLGKDIVVAEGLSRKATIAMEKSARENIAVAKGYTGHKTRSVFKPSSLDGMPDDGSYAISEQVTMEGQPQVEYRDINAEQTGGVQWKHVGDYSNFTAPTKDAWHDFSDGSRPARPDYMGSSSGGGYDYNKDVTVYSLDEAAPAFDYSANPHGSPYQMRQDMSGGMRMPSRYGEIMGQLYFGHGSSAIGAKGKTTIANAATRIKKDPRTVTVVGHASHRVEGVSDPVKVKMINFEMAQKRADAVTAALKKSGVRPALVQSVSKGDDEATGNEANDRRVDLFVN